MSDEPSKPWVPSNRHLDRASNRTAEEREAHFQDMVSKTEPYFAKVVAEGDEPWWSTTEDRRALYLRRYQRPAPPDGPGLSLDLNKIRGGERWTPAEPETEEMKAA